MNFKMKTYESFISGLIDKATYQNYTAVYNDKCEEIERAIAKRKEELDAILNAGDPHNDWITHFKAFQFTENLLDRTCLIRLIDRTLKSDSELYLVIYAGFAQSESESISKNVTWSFRKNFEEGRAVYVYGKWLGYRKGEDGQPEIVPEEAAIVERIYYSYLAGKTPQMISDELRNENTTIPGKNISFSRAMIISVLKNERYSGDCILQKTVTVDCISKTRKKNRGEAPMYLVENCHPAIIKREDFNKVQEEMARRLSRTPLSPQNALTMSGKYSKYALTDVLICGECGSRYKRCIWTSHGIKRAVWRCVSRLDNGKKYCDKSPTVYEETLKSAIVRALNKFNEEDESTYLMLMKATIGDAIGLNGGSDEIDLLDRRIEALNRKMLNMVTESVQSGEDMESHEADFKETADTIEQLQKRISAIRSSMSSDKSAKARIAEIQNIIDDRRQNISRYDDSIVRQMIECIKIYADGKLEVIFGGGYTVEESIQS